MTFESEKEAQLLFDAARKGNIEFLQNKLTNETNLCITDGKGLTPLILAGCGGHLETARLLLEAGADPNAPDSDGNTALMCVCFKGYPEIATLLIRHGAELNIQNEKGRTALMFAILYGRNEMISFLLGHGAATTMQDIHGQTAQALAAEQGNELALRLLQQDSVTNAKSA